MNLLEGFSVRLDKRLTESITASRTLWGSQALLRVSQALPSISDNLVFVLELFTRGSDGQLMLAVDGVEIRNGGEMNPTKIAGI